MKSFLLALALLSLPAAAAEPAQSTDASDALQTVGWQFGFEIGPRGPRFGFGWGPSHPGWHGHPPVQCVAMNRRGDRFVGYGRFPGEASDNALYDCYRYSRWCEVRWCR